MTPVVRMAGAVLRAEDRSTLVGPVNWVVESDQRWVLLGSNGSGKTSLLRLAGAERRPTSGTVEVLGARLGSTDLRQLRARIGMASAAVAEQLRITMTAAEAVMSARYGALEVWWHDYSDADRQRAQGLLDFVQCGLMSGRQLAALSQGERQRVMVARALMAEPELLLLDEPAAGLDLPARELLVDRLAALARSAAAAPMILVTHHVEEIPPGMTHVLLLSTGSVVASGPIDDTLNSETMTAAYGLPICLERRGDRWTARGHPRS